MAISLLQPTTFLALLTTTPTRATAETSHRAEEASQVWFGFSLMLHFVQGVFGFSLSLPNTPIAICSFSFIFCFYHLAM
uniref:Secreted protein n=1 Tax=Oryza meridionalis TaxID=40149 RepID=A0A0E0E3C4_9ORYZ